MKDHISPAPSVAPVPGSPSFVGVPWALGACVGVSRHCWVSKVIILVSGWYYFRGRFGFVAYEASILVCGHVRWVLANENIQSK